MLTPEQFKVLLDAILSRTYTLTGAADWPILAVMCSALFGLIGLMWFGLERSLRDLHSDWQRDLRIHSAENDKQIDGLWTALRDCKEEHRSCKREVHSDNR